MGVTPPPTRRAELSEFLRHLRERTAPEAVGIDVDASGRRRTPGLRREEVSALAGVGLSWYTWLEQGRDITPSPSVLDALARVFAADPSERGHLFDLAGVARPTGADPYPTTAPPELAALVAGFEPYPAFLMNPRSDVLAHNPAAARVLSIAEPGPDGTRNLLRHLFTAVEPRSAAQSQTARLTLARFRAAHARRFDDSRFRDLIDELTAASPRFRELWPRHEVLDGQLGTKTIVHPEMGTLRLVHMQTVPTSEPELRLAQYVPVDEPTRVALQRASEVSAAGGAAAADEAATADRAAAA